MKLKNTSTPEKTIRGSTGNLYDFTTSGVLHPDIRAIFKGYKLYRHQIDAIRLGTAGKDFIVT